MTAIHTSPRLNALVKRYASQVESLGQWCYTRNNITWLRYMFMKEQYKKYKTVKLCHGGIKKVKRIVCKGCNDALGPCNGNWSCPGAY